MNAYKDIAAKHVHDSLPEGAEISIELIASQMKQAPKHVDADFSLPCFFLVTSFKKAPSLVAKTLAPKVNATAAGPYLNFTENTLT